MKRIAIALLLGLSLVLPLAKESFAQCESQEMTLKLTWGNYQWFGWIPGLSYILEAKVMAAGAQYSSCMGYE